MKHPKSDKAISRRRVLQGIASGMVMLHPAVALAKIDTLLNQYYGDANIQHQFLSVEMPTLAENGNSVPIKISVADEAEPMGTIRVFAPENPAPLIAEFLIARGQEKIQISSRMRLANSQTVMAVAQGASGNLYAGTASTVITLAACVEPLL